MSTMSTNTNVPVDRSETLMIKMEDLEEGAPCDQTLSLPNKQVKMTKKRPLSTVDTPVQSEFTMNIPPRKKHGLSAVRAAPAHSNDKKVPNVPVNSSHNSPLQNSNIGHASWQDIIKVESDQDVQTGHSSTLRVTNEVFQVIQAEFKKNESENNELAKENAKLKKEIKEISALRDKMRNMHKALLAEVNKSKQKKSQYEKRLEAKVRDLEDQLALAKATQVPPSPPATVPEKQLPIPKSEPVTLPSVVPSTDQPKTPELTRKLTAVSPPDNSLSATVPTSPLTPSPSSTSTSPPSLSAAPLPLATPALTSQASPDTENLPVLRRMLEEPVPRLPVPSQNIPSNQIPLAMPHNQLPMNMLNINFRPNMHYSVPPRSMFFSAQFQLPSLQLLPFNSQNAHPNTMNYINGCQGNGQQFGVPPFPFQRRF